MQAQNLRLSSEAAQLIAENGLTWNEARKELLETYPGLNAAKLPNDDQIESALREYYAIFEPEKHAQRLKELRLIALNVMRELEAFSPVLTKGVLNGCADKFSNIYIELFSEDSKAPEIFFLDREIDFESYLLERRSKRDPVSELIVPAPTLREGVLTNENIRPYVVLRIYEEQPSRKNPKNNPDRWQIQEEARKFATIEELEALIQATASR